MVASNTLKLPYYKSIGRQRGRGFGTLAQVIEKTAIPILRKYIVPAAKHVGADLLEFAVPEVVDVVSGKKIFKTAARIVGRQALRKQLEGRKQKKHSSQNFETNWSRSWSRRDIFTKIAN